MRYSLFYRFRDTTPIWTAARRLLGDLPRVDLHHSSTHFPNRDIMSFVARGYSMRRSPTDDGCLACNQIAISRAAARSEEHTSELQSLAYLVCRLLLEKKKKCNNLNAMKKTTITSINRQTIKI